MLCPNARLKAPAFHSSRFPGRHIAGMLALRNEGSEGAVRADPPVRRVRPRAGPRRERGQKRAVSRPAHLRRNRGSRWDGARRSRGFRSALHAGVEDRSDSACAVRRAAPHCIAHNTLHSLHFSTGEIRSGPSSGPQNCVSETLANRCDESVASTSPRHGSGKVRDAGYRGSESIPCRVVSDRLNRFAAPPKGEGVWKLFWSICCC